MADFEDSKDKPFVQTGRIGEIDQKTEQFESQIKKTLLSSPEFTSNSICDLCSLGIPDCEFTCTFCGLKSHIKCLLTFYKDKLPFITCQNCAIKIKNIINENNCANYQKLEDQPAQTPEMTTDQSTIFSCLNLIFENTNISNDLKAELFKMVTNGIQMPSIPEVQTVNNAGNYNVHLNNLSFNFPCFYQPMININAPTNILYTNETDNTGSLLKKKKNASPEKHEATSKLNLKQASESYTNIDSKIDSRRNTMNLNESNLQKCSISKPVKEIPREEIKELVVDKDASTSISDLVEINDFIYAFLPEIEITSLNELNKLIDTNSKKIIRSIVNELIIQNSLWISQSEISSKNTVVKSMFLILDLIRTSTPNVNSIPLSEVVLIETLNYLQLSGNLKVTEEVMMKIWRPDELIEDEDWDLLLNKAEKMLIVKILMEFVLNLPSVKHLISKETTKIHFVDKEKSLAEHQIKTLSKKILNITNSVNDSAVMVRLLERYNTLVTRINHKRYLGKDNSSNLYFYFKNLTEGILVKNTQQGTWSKISYNNLKQFKLKLTSQESSLKKNIEIVMVNRQFAEKKNTETPELSKKGQTDQPQLETQIDKEISECEVLKQVDTEEPGSKVKPGSKVEETWDNNYAMQTIIDNLLIAEKNISYYLKLFDKSWEKKEVSDKVISLLIQLKYEKLSQNNIEIVTRIATAFFHRFYNPYKHNLNAVDSEEEGGNNNNLKDDKLEGSIDNSDQENSSKDENKIIEIIEGISIQLKDETRFMTRVKLWPEQLCVSNINNTYIDYIANLNSLSYLYLHSILIKHLTASLIKRWENRGKGIKKLRAQASSQEKSKVDVSEVNEGQEISELKETSIKESQEKQKLKRGRPKEQKTKDIAQKEDKEATLGRQRKSTNANQNLCYVCDTEVQNELDCEICRRKCHMFCACVVKKKKEWYCQLCS